MTVIVLEIILIAWKYVFISDVVVVSGLAYCNCSNIKYEDFGIELWIDLNQDAAPCVR